MGIEPPRGKIIGTHLRDAWPLDAVHMTAGHNALRGSGPGQNLAFDNALAHVGCPDRRIDRLCITRCSLLQPSHHAGCPARSRLRRKRDGLPVTLAPSHHGPGHSGSLLASAMAATLVGRRVNSAVSQGRCLVPWILGIADDGECTGHEQAAQIAVTLFADVAEPSLPPLECCFGTSPIQAEKLRPDRKVLGSATLATRAVASNGPTPGM